ncbi:MAG: amidase [Planctomycetes bacterium]|nr:amidase [Planctomycetota bacterium]
MTDDLQRDDPVTRPLPNSRRDFLRASGSAAFALAIPCASSAASGQARGDPAFASATELAQMIRRKELSSVELTRYYIGRIERFDAALNAVVVRDFERALEAARASDRLLAQGKRSGPLHGLPMTIKESFDVEGLPTTLGVPEQRDNIARSDAEVVRRLKAAGAHFLGKTNVPLRLADWQTYNDIYGTTNNPWDTGRSPGGSSGGSAAALAAGLTALEFGSDVGGSIRNPSHFCGTYGHKPTYGIVPATGHGPRGVLTAQDLNVVGPLARSAADLELALDAVAGPDASQSPAWKLALPAARVRRLRDLRVAIWPGEPGVPTSAEVSSRVQEAGAALARAGVTVSDVARPEVPATELLDTYLNLLASSGLANLPDDFYRGNQRFAAELDPADQSPLAVLSRARVLDHRSWADHDEARARYRLRWRAFFEDWDVMLCPVHGTTAFVHDQRPKHRRVVPVDAGPTSHYDHYFWVGLATLPYLPSTAFPSGLSSQGLPIGLQAIGPEYGDRTTIAVARLVAQEFGGFQVPSGFRA